jgi:hypothetical protein
METAAISPCVEFDDLCFESQSGSSRRTMRTSLGASNPSTTLDLDISRTVTVTPAAMLIACPFFRESTSMKTPPYTEFK